MSLYGMTKIDVDICQEKLNLQKSFLQNNSFLNSSGQVKNLLSVSMSANLSKNYYAEVSNRVNTLSNLSRDFGLTPVFLTITLNGCFRDAIKGDFSRFSAKDKKYIPSYFKRNGNIFKEFFTIKDLYLILNYQFNLFTTRFQNKYKCVERSYIRVFEPHKKDGVPHIHCLFYLPKHTISYLFDTFCDIFYAPQNLKNNLLTSDQIKNGEIHGFQWTLSNPTGYVMKYITKTFINFSKTDKLDELSAWYVKHKIRRFLSSRTPIPLWVYRKINFINSLRDFSNICNMKLDDENSIIEWNYDDDYIFFSIPQTNQELIYENGHLLYYRCGRLIHEYKKDKNSSPKYIDTSYRVDKIPTIKSKEQNNTDKIPYKLLPTELKAFSKMTDFEMINYYIDADKENMNVQRLAILENEMLKRNLNNFTSYNEKHNLNDILSLKNEFVERGLSYYEF